MWEEVLSNNETNERSPGRKRVYKGNTGDAKKGLVAILSFFPPISLRFLLFFSIFSEYTELSTSFFFHYLSLICFEKLGDWRYTGNSREWIFFWRSIDICWSFHNAFSDHRDNTIFIRLQLILCVRISDKKDGHFWPTLYWSDNNTWVQGCQLFGILKILGGLLKVLNQTNNF